MGKNLVLDGVELNWNQARQIANLALRDDLDRLVGGTAAHLIRLIDAHPVMVKEFGESDAAEA